MTRARISCTTGVLMDSVAIIFIWRTRVFSLMAENWADSYA